VAWETCRSLPSPGGGDVPWLRIVGPDMPPPRQRDWVRRICAPGGPRENCSRQVSWRGEVTLCLGDLAVAGALMHTRGHVSQFFPKQQFKLKLPRAAGILGMAPARNWLLAMSFVDASFQRNPTAFELYRRLGGWATETRYVNVLWDGKDFGLYYIGEQIERGPGRLQLPPVELGRPAASGFLLVADWAKPGRTWLKTKQTSTSFNLVYPDGRDASPEQLAYIRQMVDEVDRRAAVSAGLAADRARGRSAGAAGQAAAAEGGAVADGQLEAVLDFPSFARHFIVQELAKDLDGYAFSDYVALHDGKLFHAAPWDFDLAFGFVCNPEGFRDVVTGKVARDVTGWNVENARNSSVEWSGRRWVQVDFGLNRRQLFLNIWRTPSFAAAFAEAWATARRGPLADVALRGMLEKQSELIAAPAARDIGIWRRSQRCGFWPCCHPEDTQDFGLARQHLLGFLLGRARWIDAHVGELPRRR